MPPTFRGKKSSEPRAGRATRLLGVPTAIDLWRPQLHDTADEMVLEAAVNGMATDLVTWNVRDFKPAAHRFGLRVSPPDAFWTAFSKELK